MKCPKCGSENTQYVAVHHSGSSGSFTDACCGMMIFGPKGRVGGLGGARPGFTADSWGGPACGTTCPGGGGRAACKVQNTFRMIGRGIIIALMGFIAFLAIDMDELITIIIWFLAAMVIGVMCMMPPYYIKLSPALTELNEAVENAKKYKEYLDRLKKARDEENGV